MPEIDIDGLSGLGSTNTAPHFTVKPSSKSVFFMEGLDYDLGIPVDAEGDGYTIEWTVSALGERFIRTREDESLLWITPGTNTPDFVGIYVIKVKLTDDNENEPLSKEYEFRISLEEDPDNPVSGWGQDQGDYTIPDEIISWNPAWDEDFLFVDQRNWNDALDVERPIP
eukprot:CAMPEP_0176375000 /NCGR_PEP_ID=MMETSP0126-20121128/27194_1 /TAXON_ID=141414 ORGANISM="Strombidinopsis acuminatum, Strain SPMC142" /NCGR_SAMPLE_ID=MMETSP0126 /ASSEMBLY_ACC=CAM_ASM_000229 /LENGTH=168 /DNA_ID=CAMNT_0017735887 /DNA_START=696 /DNA_END=1202 /DNA_ORIENTATION=-